MKRRSEQQRNKRPPHFVAAILLAFFVPAMLPAKAEPRIYDYEVVAEYPHDPSAFTQGLFYRDGYLYESTGQYGASSLRKARVETGEIVMETALPANVFGEGATPTPDGIAVLTWKNGKGFILDAHSFERRREFSYAGEGWGLTGDGRRLVMSDGTSTLRFLDPRTLEETGRISVTYGGRRLPEINELEWVDGEIYANIWRTEVIARINPENGEVTGLVDMRGLRDRLGPDPGDAEVLNGIAWDAEHRRLFVTGKYWPKLFEIRLVARESAN